jgi:hypothetical protein
MDEWLNAQFHNFAAYESAGMAGLPPGLSVTVRAEIFTPEAACLAREMVFSWAASLAPLPGTSSQVTGNTAGFNKDSLKQLSCIEVLIFFLRKNVIKRRHCQSFFKAEVENMFRL